MLVWLSDWLRDIIAIILLAVIVELLLPNKAMQRYARLVIGLFILLTILSPILKLIQSDISTKLDEGMELWTKTEQSQGSRMAAFNQIQQDAKKLMDQREQDAAKLTERTLEENMRKELIERTKVQVSSVDADLKWVVQAGSRTPYISHVIVTLKTVDKQAAEGASGSTSVDKVMPVDVVVSIDIASVGSNLKDQQSADKNGSSPSTDLEQQADERWIEAEPQTTASVRSLLLQGWGVEPENIIVRHPSGY